MADRKPGDVRHPYLDTLEAVIRKRLTLHLQEGLAIVKRHKGQCIL
jgi:hypothetical protein